MNSGSFCVPADSAWILADFPRVGAESSRAPAATSRVLADSQCGRPNDPRVLSRRLNLMAEMSRAWSGHPLRLIRVVARTFREVARDSRRPARDRRLSVQPILGIQRAFRLNFGQNWLSKLRVLSNARSGGKPLPYVNSFNTVQRYTFPAFTSRYLVISFLLSTL